MTCQPCAEAETNPGVHSFTAGCLECSARALAHGPIYWAAAKADALTPAYRSALQALAGADWKACHERVKYYAGRISG
jgi:hypothetical protein